MTADEKNTLWNTMQKQDATASEVLPPVLSPPTVYDGFPEADRSAPRPHHHSQHNFAQLFGLHPGIAFLTFVVDSMLFAHDFMATILAPFTGGASVLVMLSVSSLAGVILGVITYMAQQKWYGDDKQSAFIKALILAFLTAVPTNIPAFVYVSAGIVGFFRRKE